MPADRPLRRVKYLNNVIEHDHRFIKKKMRYPMLQAVSYNGANSPRYRSCEYDEEATSQTIKRSECDGSGEACLESLSNRRVANRNRHSFGSQNDCHNLAVSALLV
jgi:hypothetical protein